MMSGNPSDASSDAPSNAPNESVQMTLLSGPFVYTSVLTTLDFSTGIWKSCGGSLGS